MLSDEKLIRVKDLLVNPETKIKLKDFDTKYSGQALNKQDSEALLEVGRKQLAVV